MSKYNAAPEGADAKQIAILEAAFEAFAMYGFRRTSMEDIARGAGMSRAALYLHYKNKAEIYRSLVQTYYDRAVADVATALGGASDPTAALLAAFEAHTGPVFEVMLKSPHGQELLDTKHSNSADIARQGEARMREVYADWLRRGDAAGQIRLAEYGSAEEVAETLLRALYGIKENLFDVPDYRQPLRRLAAMLGRALTP